MELAHSETFADQHPLELRALLLDALPGLALAALLLASFLFLVHPAVLRGDLLDPDSYMHVVRLRSILADGSWHGGFLARDNAPYGMVLHWTKAYDLVFLALAAPLAAVAGWPAALALVAPVLGPLSLLALVVTAVWAVRPVTDAGERRFLGMVLAVTPLAVNYGLVGTATYHVPIVVAWTLFMGLALRSVMPPHALAHGIGAGLAAAFALWLTVECILVVGLGAALMALAWIRSGGGLRRANLGFAATLALALAALLACDPPYAGWLDPALERLSIVYVVFALLLALVAAALALAPQRSAAWRARLAVGAGGAVLSLACLATLFPMLLSPVHAVFGDELVAQFWSRIQEGKPVYASPSRAVLFMAGPAMGLLAALVFAWRERTAAPRLGWASVALMLALLSLPGLLHSSFAIHPEVLAALPIAVLALRVGALIDRHAPPTPLRLLARAFAMTLLLIGPIMLAGAMSLAESSPAPPPPDCRVRRVAAALNDPTFMHGSDFIVMTAPDQAPEVLYWTTDRVVAGPYHLNVQGLHDVFAFMTGTDEGRAYAILARRGVAYVLTCNWPVKARAGVKPDDETLEDRLALGEAPAWLAPVPWPAGTKSDLRLFRVNAAAAPR
ncbi:MAG TPA: hypothetical protein VL244_01525 [Alphaproteobacteria bacterium]|nr:hypothetical protein [Alphaproteobacteria bacterium]